MARICILPDRSVFSIGGPEAKSFLQDLLTNNLDLVSPTRAIYTCLLTPQGKYLFDFFLIEHDGAYLAECDKDAAPQLLKRLMFYKLRAAVDLKDLSDSWVAGVAIDDAADEPGAAQSFCGGVRFQDPRLAQLGTRFLIPASKSGDIENEANGEALTPADYDLHRLRLGVPGSDDLLAEKTFPMEANLDVLNAIDFHKGCFVGQEVTSRTYRQGKVRKRTLPLSANETLPPAHSLIMAGDRQAGELLSTRGNIGIGIVRLDRLGEPLATEGLNIDVHFPDWLPKADLEDVET
jgi:tRNA-modifying protein YgfZ